MDRPTDKCFLVDHNLWAGEYPINIHDVAHSAKLDAILGFGVDVFIDFTADADGMLPYDKFLPPPPHVTHVRFPIPDTKVTDMAIAHSVCDTIRNCLLAKKVIYMHCWGGIGRTGTMAACWLKSKRIGEIHSEEDNLRITEEVLAEMREKFKMNPKSKYKWIPENDLQVNFVLKFQP